MASSPITSWQIEGEKLESLQILLSWAPKPLQMVTAAMKLKDACSLKGKDLYSQTMVFLVFMYRYDSWTIK